MRPAFEVVNPGLLTTVQDLGRHGWQQYGIPVSGAMDTFALQVANLLVGNPRSEAGLEITLMGPVLRALDDLVIALCGADLGPLLDGEPAPLWKSFRIRKGQVLRFQGRRSGARAYLAVAGGIAVNEIMGSKSTYLKGVLGGFRGRALQKGDILYAGFSGERLARVSGRGLSRELIPVYEKEMTVRVVLGPHAEAFTEEGLETFLSGTYRVTPQSDRMGYRLDGPKIQHKESADIISEAVAFGSVQVPANGQPIILMADRQTTGGYPIIATVISADLPRIAQLLPGDAISFREIGVEEAQNLYIEQERLLRTLEVAANSNTF